MIDFLSILHANLAGIHNELGGNSPSIRQRNSLSRPPKKFSELLSHFKAQYFLASMFCLFLSGIPKNYLSVACAAFALAINSSGMMSFYYAGRRKRVGRQPLKIALININHTNSVYAQFSSWASAQPLDVLVIQEVNQAWAGALAALNQQYPFSIVLPRERGSGIALYSRTPMESHSLELGEGNERPGIYASLAIGRRRINIVSFHPRGADPQRSLRLAQPNAGCGRWSLAKFARS